MNRERVLAVLYDLALTIGGEVSLTPLLTRTLQRLLFHTGFPAGLVLHDPHANGLPPRVAAAVGDYELAAYVGRVVALAPQLHAGDAAIVEAPELLDTLPCEHGRYRACLRLPVPGNGAVLLLAPELPPTELPLTQIFQPVMGNLGHAMALCATSDAHRSSLQADRDAARLALQEREAVFRSIVEQAVDAIALVDAETLEFAEFNEAACRNLGYTRAEFARLRLPDIVDVAPEQLCQEREAIAARGSLVFDSRHRARDGSLREVRVSTRRVDFGGRAYISAMWMDITEERRAEAALRESEARLYSLFANMHEGVALFQLVRDPAGVAVDYRLVDCNRRAEVILGMNRREAIGRRTSEVLRRPRPPLLRTATTVVDSGQSAGVETYYAETDRYLSISLVPWRSDGFATVIDDVTERKRIQENLERAATYDPLTQLPNRLLLSDRLQQAEAQARRSGRLLAVCYLDLDGFKEVNDRHGHDAGDGLLVLVAQRLQENLRGGDTVARLGGDEFALLLCDLNSPDECQSALERLLYSLALPYQFPDVTISSISASVGATLFPNDDSDTDTLLRHADQAMYVAKQRGKNRYHLFDTIEDRELRSHHEALTRIQQAMADGEFAMYYQPKVDMRAGTVVGVEALIRWLHPQRGVLVPAEFLPAVDASDFAVRLGEWVIQEAVGHAAEWHRQGLRLTVSMNVSPRHFQHPDFVDRLAAILARYPELPRSALQLEVVETAALADLNHVSALMRDCQKLGVSFALDDFGTGYSSLTYLRRLPAEVLKIDQSFVRDMLRDPDDMAIVEGVIGLATAFQRQPVAEGVETTQHGALLMQMGCDVGQGHGIARAMPAGELPAWIAAYRQDPLWQEARQSRWLREDLPLLSAALEHRQWVEAIVEAVEDAPKAGSVVLPLDVHECNFGKWYDGAGTRRFGHLGHFAAIGPLHVEAHRLGRELLGHARAGRGARADKSLAALRAQAARLLAELEALRGQGASIEG